MNEEIMNENEEMTEVDELDTEEVGSGNSFNAGVAAVGAAVLGGLIFGGVKLAKKIKAKKEAKKTEDTGEEPVPEKPQKEKGLRLGKKRLVVIDERTEIPAEE